MRRPTSPGDRLPPVTLTEVGGRPVALDSLVTRPTIVPLVRYYGCMPCQAFLRQLARLQPELDDLGVGVLGVGGAADFQARHLMDTGVGFPLLLDADHNLYAALDVNRIRWWKLLSLFTWCKYFRAARHARQGRITGHVLQAPGLVILDPGLTVRFLYRGQTLGDYPPIAEVVAEARRLAAQAR